MTNLALLSLIITAAALFGWFSSRVLRLPITIGTMVLTVVTSITLILLSGRLPGLHLWSVALVGRLKFEDLILHGMLALLLFAGAFLLDLDFLAREKLTVGLLSVFGTLLSAAAVSSLLHWALPLIGLSAPWLECLFFGSLISPTDPIAVLEMLHRVGVPKNIQAQLAGESLFNDGIGAVLFLALLGFARGSAPSPLGIGLIILSAAGGLLLGLALAAIASTLMRLVHGYQVEILLTLALALGGYSLAETMLLSAPLEAVAAGLALRHLNRTHRQWEIAHDTLDGFWRVIDEVQNAILFVLLGLEVLVIPFNRTAFASGGLAIFAVVAARFGIVALLVNALRLLQPGHKSSILTLGWGGLRGGLSIALALSVPEANGRSWILATTYLVVLFSIIIQGSTLDLFLRRFGGQLEDHQPSPDTTPTELHPT